jgi:hypothetical protein
MVKINTDVLKNISRFNLQRGIFIVLISSGISLLSFAQDSSDLADYPGKWFYTNNNLSGEWFGERHYKMTSTELEKYHATTEKLVKYLHQQPVAQNPLGVNLNVQARAFYNHYDHALAPSERVKAEIYVPFCNLIHNNGKIDHACTEVSYIQMRTNDESAVYETAMNFDKLDDKKALNQFKEIFCLPKELMDIGSGVFLYNWYYENRIVVARTDRPLWMPVTNKEYITRMMVYYTASLKEGLIPQMVIDALKGEIAAIPPEMMMMPAYINGNTNRPLTGICTMEEDSTKALYKINPNYFDLALPRTSVQLITITIEGHADDPEWGEISAHRVWEFIKGLKGSDLRELLDVK